MFRGNFTVAKTDDGYIEGRFTGQTPAGPFDATFTAPVPYGVYGDDPDTTQKIVREVMGECLGVAEYFPVDSLIGQGPTSYAVKLLRRLHSKNAEVKTKAEKEYGIIRAKSKAGQSQAMDVSYAIARMMKEALEARAYRQNEGPVLTEDLLLGFDYAGVVSAVKMRSLRDMPTRTGINIYQRMNQRKLKTQMMPIYKRLKVSASQGDDDAYDIVQTVKTLSRAELERRRQLRGQAYSMGGFSFDGFMSSLKQIAGPLVKRLAPLARKIPYIGPALAPALKTTGELMSPQKQKGKAARKRVKLIMALANAGNPKAVRARAALKAAKSIRRAAVIAKGIKEGAIVPSKKPPVSKPGPTIAKVMAIDPGIVSAHRAGVHAGLQRARKVYGKAKRRPGPPKLRKHMLTRY